MPQFLENVLRAISSAEKYYLVPKYWNDALLSYELRKTKGSENVLPMFKRTYRNGNFIHSTAQVITASATVAATTAVCCPLHST